jgi:hypothetical protein
MKRIRINDDIIRIREKSWIAKFGALYLNAESVAMVIGKTIYIHGVDAEYFLNNPLWVKHEYCHIQQYKRYGAIRFLILYLYYSMRKGYYNNPFEVEARAAEDGEELDISQV